MARHPTTPTRAATATRSTTPSFCKRSSPNYDPAKCRRFRAAQREDKIRKVGDKYQVTNQAGTEVLGEHDTREAAVRQLAAIEAEKDRDDQPLTRATINDLPDTAFAIILSGGEKDDSGRTVPRSLRKLPHHTGAVKSASENTSLDLPRLRNALARVNQIDASPAQIARAKAHLDRHANAVLKSRKK